MNDHARETLRLEFEYRALWNAAEALKPEHGAGEESWSLYFQATQRAGVAAQALLDHSKGEP